MPEYLSPGVYIEEVDTGPKPIQGVGTAVAAFVGFTEKAQRVERVDGEIFIRDLTGKAQLITNWSQFLENFGGFVEGAYLPHAEMHKRVFVLQPLCDLAPGWQHPRMDKTARELLDACLRSGQALLDHGSPW